MAAPRGFGLHSRKKAIAMGAFTSKPRLTLASGITLARAALLPPMLYLLLGTAWREVAFGLLLAILAGDLLDGLLARLRREETELGRCLDPVVDKVVFLSVFAALALRGELSWAALGLLLAIQGAILLGGLLWLRALGRAPTPRPLGKAASFVISLGLIAAFAQVPRAEWVVYGGIALSYGAGLDYLLSFWRAWRAQARPHARAQAQAPRARAPHAPNRAEIRAGEGP